MGAAGDTAGGPVGVASEDMAELIAIVRRVVAARVPEGHVDDLVQETLARVIAARDRIEPGMVEPYAIVTARHVVASMWQQQERQRRNQHRILDLSSPSPPDEDLLEQEESQAVRAALARLSDRERETLVAHEVAGRGTQSIAEELGSTKGAVAAQLNRTRARLRVEYLLSLEHMEPPTDRCRAVLLSLSSGDRRRQRLVDAGRHLLECDFCARLSQPLVERRPVAEDEVHVPISVDADIVRARQQGREIAARAGFSRTDMTLIATAISEISRNIVRFAGHGELVISLLESPRRGILVVARDIGPGIPDLELALQDGYSTYGGLGLGLPGCRRLVDEFAIVSDAGKGTTVTMTKWAQEG